MYTSFTFFLKKLALSILVIFTIAMMTSCNAVKPKNNIEQKTNYTVHYVMLMECKISIAMTPHIQSIFEKYESSHQFNFICHFPESYVAEESNLEQWKQEYGLSVECRVDSLDQQIIHLGGSRAPQAIVVNELTSEIVYSGRINNLFAALGKRRPQVTDHTLDKALQQIINEEQVIPSTSEIIGCALN